MWPTRQIPIAEVMPTASSDSKQPLLSKIEGVLQIDARGLEPPLPMVTALEAIGSLPPGSKLTVITERNPIFLLAELEGRHISYQCASRPDESWLTMISL